MSKREKIKKIILGFANFPAFFCWVNLFSALDKLDFRPRRTLEILEFDVVVVCFACDIRVPSSKTKFSLLPIYFFLNSSGNRTFCSEKA